MLNFCIIALNPGHNPGHYNRPVIAKFDIIAINVIIEFLQRFWAYITKKTVILL
jgi:hypothetical protein